MIVRAVLSRVRRLASSPLVSAQDKPSYGGELVFVVPGEPPSYDAHREETFALIHPTRQIGLTVKQDVLESAQYFAEIRGGNHRIIPHSAKVRGWTITPSHYINQQLDTVWLAH